ncbi:MAG: hypothetical protein HZC28_18190 [Spirochaetes bacterium]|nr:hypothetical protein [Spirochaetota bacterium]
MIIEKKNIPIYAGVFLVSLAVLAYENIINRVFSLVFWYHFAFMVVSVALFGIGLGALIVFFINKFVKRWSGTVLGICTLLLAISLPLTLMGINSIPLEMEKIATDAVHKAYFIKFFLLLASPFVLAGFVFSFLFTNYKEDINRIYFFDLVGGGIGCFAALAIFPHNGPFIASFFLAAAMVVAAGAFAFRERKWIAIIVPAVVLALAFIFVFPMISKTEIRISNAKRYLWDLPLAATYHDWDNFGYTAVHPREKQQGSYIVTGNYSTYTYMFDMRGVDFTKPFDISKRGLEGHAYPFIVRPEPENVGIVGVGAGKDVLLSLKYGAKNVYGAEFNPTIYDVFQNKYAEYTGNLGRLSNVHIACDEGRFFIRSSKRNYDVLLFDNAIAIAAVNSGAFTLAEGYLYTVEAIMDYMGKLTTNGVLYLSNPLSDYSRFITITREAFKRMGRADEYKQCVIVAKDPNKVYQRCKVMLKNSPYTPKEVAAVMAFTESIGHVVWYAPFTNVNTYASRLVTTRNIEREYAQSERELRPSTDDWPFYSQAYKDRSSAGDASMKDLKKDNYHYGPFLMLREIAVYVFLGSLIFLVLPLIIFNLKGFKELNNKVGSIIYFSGVGLGFMFMEIVLMQKYMLVLGHPVYSFAVVLSSLLIATGIGSFVSDYIKKPYTAVVAGGLGIIVATVAAFIFMKYFTNSVIELVFWQRVLIISLMTALSGFFMGFMIPSGIRAVSKVESSIPWLWSINSVFSTVAGFVAIYVSIQFGFTVVLIASLACYAVGILAFVFKIVPRESIA